MTNEELLLLQEDMELNRDIIILAHLNLTKSVIGSYVRKFPILKEEIISAGYWGLVKAVNRFESRGLQCSKYIRTMVDAEIRVAIKNNYPVPYTELDNLSIMIEPDDSIELMELVAKFDKFDRRIMKYLLFGYSQREIGEKIGVSVNTVSCRINKIRKRMVQLNAITLYPESTTVNT